MKKLLSSVLFCILCMPSINSMSRYDKGGIFADTLSPEQIYYLFRNKGYQEKMSLLSRFYILIDTLFSDSDIKDLTQRGRLKSTAAAFAFLLEENKIQGDVELGTGYVPLSGLKFLFMLRDPLLPSSLSSEKQQLKLPLLSTSTSTSHDANSSQIKLPKSPTRPKSPLNTLRQKISAQRLRSKSDPCLQRPTSPLRLPPINPANHLRI